MKHFVGMTHIALDLIKISFMGITNKQLFLSWNGPYMLTFENITNFTTFFAMINKYRMIDYLLD